MGRLLEKYGFTVARKYNCSLDDIGQALENKHSVIAVVDYGLLWYGEPDGEFHAVVCLGLAEGAIRIYDPAAGDHKRYPVVDFCKAWDCSQNYLVCAGTDSLEYIPHPIDVSDVRLDDELLELTEAIAENAHEVWANQRRSEGWTYGPKRNDALRQHPDMVPYSRLDEGEKDYDRVMAFNTLRLVKKLGFNISRRYTLYCPNCGEFVEEGMNFCPHCGEKL
ncbi:MAG: zinc-ribbon domain-containing protein [Bacteroidales bacterium]|nr:zinc-ribbon domain-containing protein [Bacteroidales bacterium]